MTKKTVTYGKTSDGTRTVTRTYQRPGGSGYSVTHKQGVLFEGALIKRSDWK